MKTNAPGAVNTDISNVLTCLPEKFIVDFANGIDVSRDHIRAQKKRNGFFNRLCDSFTGNAAQRQVDINGSLVDGIEGSLIWLNEISLSITKSNLTVIRLTDRVASIQNALIDVADYSADTRELLTILSLELNKRFCNLNHEISRIDLVQRANIHLDLVLSKWEAGKLDSFSLSGRCYAALEDLRWGEFGDYWRHNTASQDRSGLLTTLQNRAICLLAKDAGVSPSSRVNTHLWLTQSAEGNALPEANDALAYVGDWSVAENEPFVYSVTRLPDELPLLLPRISSAERVAKALVAEVFRGN